LSSAWFLDLAHSCHFTDTTVASISTVDADDDDFDPNQKKKKRSKTVSKDAPELEAVRKEAHILDEHHEHILSASYDLSFNGSSRDAGLDPSTVGDPGFDNFFSDGLEDAGGYGMELGEDLARELGWGISPVKSVRGSERYRRMFFLIENESLKSLVGILT
jgi:meiotic recombination protein REC8